MSGFIATKRYQRLRAVIIVNIFLLIINTVSFVFVSSPGIAMGESVETSYSMRVCPEAGSCIESTYYRLENNTCTAISLIPSEVTANDYATLAECESQIGMPTPTPTATATPTPTPTATGVPGYALPGLVVSPNMEEDIFTDTGEGFIPNVKIIQVSGVNVIDGESIQIYNREPKFFGTTNLRDAIIFAQLDYEPKKVYMFFADSSGSFSFQFPILFDVGSHAIYLTAMSQKNPYFKANTLFEFEIIPILPAKPSPTAIPTPFALAPSPTIAPVPSVSLYPLPFGSGGLNPITSPFDFSKKSKHAPIEIINNAYSLRIKIDDASKRAYPGKLIQFSAKIARLFPTATGEEAIRLRYYVTDPNGKIVMDKTENLLIKNLLQTFSQFSTPLNTLIGKYALIGEISMQDLVFVSSDSFEIIEPSLTIFLGMTISQGRLVTILLSVFWILLFMLLVFLALLYLEYKKCREAEQVSEADLYKDKDII